MPPAGLANHATGFSMAMTVVDHAMPMSGEIGAGTPAALRLRHLCKEYRTALVATTALDDVNFDVRRGEFVAIMGPSGCGKSTLLNVIGLLDTPTSGSYVIGTEDVARCSTRRLNELRRTQIGFVFQSFNLIEQLDVFENVELPLLYRGVPRSDRESMVMEALTRVSLEPRAKHWPAQLSGGQQQRVAVARALVGRPALVVADEPTGNLDSRSGEEVMDLLDSIHRDGTTIVMVTHSDEHARRAGRVVRMLDGRIVANEVG